MAAQTSGGRYGRPAPTDSVSRASASRARWRRRTRATTIHAATANATEMTASVAWTALNPTDWSSRAMFHIRVTHTYTVQIENARMTLAWPRVMSRRYPDQCRCTWTA